MSGTVKAMFGTVRSPRRQLFFFALLWTVGMGTWFLLYRQPYETCGIEAFRYCYFGFPLKAGLGQTGIGLLWAAGLVAIGATMLVRVGAEDVRAGAGDVLAGAVRSAAVIQGVDASVAALEVDGNTVLVVSAGLSTPEIEQERELARWPEPAKQLLLRSLDGSSSNDAPIQRRLAVPFETGRPRRGRLVIFTRSSEDQFGASELRRLKELAERVGPGLEKARISPDVPF